MTTSNLPAEITTMVAEAFNHCKSKTEERRHTLLKEELSVVLGAICNQAEGGCSDCSLTLPVSTPLENQTTVQIINALKEHFTVVFEEEDDDHSTYTVSW